MNIIEEALLFAAKAHKGQKRKLTGLPYILHPMEVASIAASLTTEEEIIAACLLHDTVEDCGVMPETIREKFGSRVYALVASETEDKFNDHPPEETWLQRKSDSLLVLSFTKDSGVKILWLSDKLSNLRSFVRTHEMLGDSMWLQLHQHDPKQHEWYYRKIAEYLSPLSDTDAYREYLQRVDQLFGGI